MKDPCYDPPTIQIQLNPWQVEYLINGLKDLIDYNRNDPRIGKLGVLGDEPREVMLENMIIDNSEIIRILQESINNRNRNTP